MALGAVWKTRGLGGVEYDEWTNGERGNAKGMGQARWEVAKIQSNKRKDIHSGKKQNCDY